MNIKAIFKSIIAGCTIVGGAILGNEARKCFTKPVAPDEFDEDDVYCEDCDPAEEAEDEQAEEAD